MAPAPAVCDSHVHVFDPVRFAYLTPRRFTPGEATVTQLLAHMRRLELARVVLVQPSVYGADNACLLDALRVLGARARGVAVLSRHTSAAEIAGLAAAGVRGARLNLVVDQLETPTIALLQLSEIEDRMPANWHVQLHVSQNMLGALAPHMRQSPRTYVLDHMGLPDVASGTRSKAWTDLLQLMQGGRLYVKLSAPYLLSRQPPPHEDLQPFVASLASTRADRLLWGSNWPHTQGSARAPSAGLDSVEAFREVDDRDWLASCRQAAGAEHRAVLSQNAARLYEFS